VSSRIVEKGTHAELLAENRLYAQMYEKFISHAVAPVPPVPPVAPEKEEGPVLKFSGNS